MPQILIDQNTVTQAALRTISCEKEGLSILEQALQGYLAAPFFQAFKAIAACKGRVIVTGLGKSGHIGAKIAATFASTGTPSFFVHAAEANHGDLGMIAADDVILALSWSGKTSELAGILKHAARASIPLIACTADASSILGKQADILLQLPEIEEACPHGLAPTSSTTLQLALGDALAIALLEARGFTAKDFKKYHPGGSLGAKLQFVRDIMHKGDAIPMVGCESTMANAMKILSEKHFGCVAIIDARGALAGILTEGDLARNLHLDLSQAKVEEVMTKTPKTIKPDMQVGAATALIQNYKISALLVVEEEKNAESEDIYCKPVGIVHFHDLL